MIKTYKKFIKGVTQLQDLALLFIRLILAYGFYMPAMNKWGNMEGIAQWFGSMNYPLPTLNAYLAGTTEATGVVLLFFGLGTRIISIPLMITMLVAIFTVHIGNGFAAADNGIEIPLYYLLMLVLLLAYGSGKYSIDYFLTKKREG
ncbi:MAG: DoxX family protein [Bacteroidales bacterium]|nr:DoxX family protein [Bacteroidales bacterium]MCF8337303.1 DoxX family protein [Bacteroidales bacterium]